MQQTIITAILDYLLPACLFKGYLLWNKFRNVSDKPNKVRFITCRQTGETTNDMKFYFFQQS